MDEIAREQAALAVCIDKCSSHVAGWSQLCFHIGAFAELQQLLARRNAIEHVLKEVDLKASGFCRAHANAARNVVRDGSIRWLRAWQRI
ncbi:hypothetical protein [Mesorhizobium loti]|uniref:hypothetical protein n=1 Tax=Mesorhizobium TaxID=68287 RepID=UPI0015561B48|nr:hypothetical protein [Mesorhizobium loti]